MTLKFIKKNHFMEYWLPRILTGTSITLFFQLGYVWASKGHHIASMSGGNTALDGMIPLVPIFIVPYIAGYFFVFAPLLLLSDRKDYYWGSTIFIAVLSIGFLSFKFFPVLLDRSYATGDDIFSKITLLQKKIDTPLNNCPSFHVALNTYCWGSLYIKYGKKMLQWIWIPALIIASTLLVKQHLIIDVIGGIILGAGATIMFHSLRNNHSLSRPFFAVSQAFVLIMVFSNWQQIEVIWGGITNSGLSFATSNLHWFWHSEKCSLNIA